MKLLHWFKTINTKRLMGMKPEEIKAFVQDIVELVEDDRKPAPFPFPVPSVVRVCPYCRREFDYDSKSALVICLECRVEMLVREHLCSANDFAAYRK